MVYLGDYKKNDVVYYIWNTAGVSGWTSINPSTSGVVGVYKNTTAAMSVGDVVYNVGFDGLAGLNDITVPTSGAFFVVASDYYIVVSGAVIDGETVNAAICSFSLENRYVSASTIDTISGNLTTMQTNIDTVSGNLNLGVSVNVSGIAPEALTQMVASGDAEGWNDIAIDTTLGDIISGVWSQNLDNGDFAISGYAGQKLKNIHLVQLGAAQIETSGSAQYMRVYNNVLPTGTIEFEFRLYNQANGNPLVSETGITGRDRISE